MAVLFSPDEVDGTVGEALGIKGVSPAVFSFVLAWTRSELP